MSRLSLFILNCGVVFAMASPSAMGEYPPLCVHGEAAHSDLGVVAGGAAPLEGWSELADSAIVLEYGTVFNVHTPFDPSRPMRSQPGSFFVEQILSDLECFVDPAGYHFVLMFSVQEVPGWIHSGPRGVPAPAKNIGVINAQYGSPSAYPGWPKLLLAPHMNSINFIEGVSEDFGLRTAMHEIGHAWNVFWANASNGPREWMDGDPVAWLGSCCGHWSWNWVDANMPGMMYSAPTVPRFNEFDLYAMGLMTYAEAASASYLVYEDSGQGPGPVHLLALDDLIFSLSVAGSAYYEGDGKRIPAVDPQTAELQALVVIIKGAGETVTPTQEASVVQLTQGLPQAWFEATGGRSMLHVGLSSTPQVDQDEDGVLDCVDNCPLDANPGQEDIDADGLGDACDPCPHVSIPSLWDLDHREGFTLHDFHIFQNCFSGAQPATPACLFADFSGGGNIDLSDYIPLGQLMTGNCP